MVNAPLCHVLFTVAGALFSCCGLLLLESRRPANSIHSGTVLAARYLMLPYSKLLFSFRLEYVYHFMCI